MCSMWRPDRRPSAVGAGDIDRHRPAARLLAVDVALEHPILEQRLVLLAAVAGIGPDAARRVGRVEELAEPRPGMRRGIGHRPAPDQPVAPIGADVVLVAEGRDRDVDRRQLAVRVGPWPWCTSPSSAHRGPSAGAWPVSPPSRSGMRPSLSACFSALLLRCLGAATRLAQSETSLPPSESGQRILMRRVDM